MTQFHRLLVAGSLTAVVVGSVVGVGSRLGAFGMGTGLVAATTQVAAEGREGTASSEPGNQVTVPDPGGVPSEVGGVGPDETLWTFEAYEEEEHGEHERERGKEHREFERDRKGERRAESEHRSRVASADQTVAASVRNRESDD